MKQILVAVWVCMAVAMCGAQTGPQATGIGSGQRATVLQAMPVLWRGFRSQPLELGHGGERDVPAGATGGGVCSNVPPGKTWNVTGAFMIINSLTSVIDPPQAYWEIRSGVSNGNGGTLVASGTSAAAYKPTQGTDLYALLVKNLNVTLVSGRYWVSVVPICTNLNDTSCQSAQYFSVDVEDMPPPNRYGPLEPADDSFFNSTSFNDNWVALGPTFCGAGCDRFSAGILGTAQ